MASSMKAAYITGTGPPSVLQVSEIWPKPVRQPGQVLIHINAASVNPVDLKIRGGAVPALIAKKQQILGGDLAGVVEEADASSRFKVGDMVYGLTDGFAFWTAHGTYAEYICVPDNVLAVIPPKLSFQEAASLPLVALTAYQALKPAHLQPGQRVLVHAGSGGVGTAAIQIAKSWGAYVVTTASANNTRFLMDLGADEVVDYNSERFEEKYSLNPFDVIVDTIGGDYEVRSLQVLKAGGYFAHILNQGWVRSHGHALGTFWEGYGVGKGLVRYLLRRGPRYSVVFVQPSGLDMAAISQMVEAGQLRPVIDRTFLLDNVREAHEYLEQGHVRGKVVLQI